MTMRRRRHGWLLGRIWSYMHRQTSHSKLDRQNRPVASARRWVKAVRRFEDRHLARRGRASARFLNEYTAHRWL